LGEIEASWRIPASEAEVFTNPPAVFS